MAAVGGYGSVAGGGYGSAGCRCLTKFVQEGSVESQRYYLSRRTVWEMLRDRGYEVAESELTRSLAEFRREFGDQPDLKLLRISASLFSNPNLKLLVIYMGTEEIRKGDITCLSNQIPEKESLQGLILILQSKMNHFARKELLKFPFKAEVFQITELLVNITKHILGPRFDILTAEQKQQLLTKYMSEDKQLPRMLVTDPVAQYYGLEKGQVVKITYSGGLVDSLVTYRCIT